MESTGYAEGEIYFINELKPVKLCSWINELIAKKTGNRKLLLIKVGTLGLVCEKDSYFNVTKEQQDFTNVITMDKEKIGLLNILREILDV